MGLFKRLFKDVVPEAQEEPRRVEVLPVHTVQLDNKKTIFFSDKQVFDYWVGKLGADIVYQDKGGNVYCLSPVENYVYMEEL